MDMKLVRIAIVLFFVVLLGLFDSVTPAARSISMLDVGQGDSLLFQDGAVQVLVDGGPGAEVLTRLGEEMPWFDRKVDVVIATHFDRDHLEGLSHVLHRYEVGMVLMPHYTATSTSLKEQFLRLVEEKNIPYRFAWYGQQISAGDMTFRVISPIPGNNWERLSKNKSNNASIIMRMDYIPKGGAESVSMLLTGDAESGIERQLLSSVPLSAFNVDILKVGHHGSKTSTTQELVDAATPASSFVSVGEGNSYGHPTDEVLARLTKSQVFRTDTMGTVVFRLDGNSWKAICHRKTDLPFLQQLCIKK